MPVKTVTLQVAALTDAANRQIAATGAYFEKLRAANPVELKVKLDAAQAIAESKILAREMRQVVTDTVRLQADRDRGGTGGIGGLFARVFGGGGGAGSIGSLLSIGGGAAGGAARAGGGLAGAFASLPPQAQAGVAVGAIGVGLATLPFIAQAAATGITLALGGGLTAIGIYAASKSKDVQNSFAQLKAAAVRDLGGIGTPFNKSIQDILKTAQTVLPGIAATFTAAIRPIAGPLDQLGKTLVKAFADPAVAASVKAVGTAFGAILKAVAPVLPGAIDAIAGGIKRIADAVARNPKPFADFVRFLATAATLALNALAWLTNVAAYIEQHFIPAFRGVARFFTSTLPAAFDIFRESASISFGQVEIAGLKAALGITTAFGHLPSFLGAPFRSASASIRGELAKVQGDVLNAVNNIAADWARLNGLTATLRLVVARSQGPGGSGSLAGGLAGGTASAAPGWTWVGERGPELLRMRGGEQVIPHGAAVAAAGGGYGAQIVSLLDEQNDLLTRLIGVTADAPARTGAALGMASRSQVYRELYP